MLWTSDVLTSANEALVSLGLGCLCQGPEGTNRLWCSCSLEELPQGSSCSAHSLGPCFRPAGDCQSPILLTCATSSPSAIKYQIQVASKLLHIRDTVVAHPTSPAHGKCRNSTSLPLSPCGVKQVALLACPAGWEICTWAVTTAWQTCTYMLSHRNVIMRQSFSSAYTTKAKCCPHWSWWQSSCWLWHSQHTSPFWWPAPEPARLAAEGAVHDLPVPDDCGAFKSLKEFVAAQEWEEHQLGFAVSIAVTIATYLRKQYIGRGFPGEDLWIFLSSHVWITFR